MGWLKRGELALHGSALNDIFKTELDNETLVKRIFGVELELEQASEQYRVGYILTDKYEKRYEIAMGWLREIVGDKINMIHIDKDSSGYILKLKPEHVGGTGLSVNEEGYGILTPGLRD